MVFEAPAAPAVAIRHGQQPRGGQGLVQVPLEHAREKLETSTRPKTSTKPKTTQIRPRLDLHTMFTAPSSLRSASPVGEKGKSSGALEATLKAEGSCRVVDGSGSYSLRPGLQVHRSY